MTMPTIVANIKFINRESLMLSWVEHEKKFYNLGALLPIALLHKRNTMYIITFYILTLIG